MLTPSGSLQRALSRLSAKSPLCRGSAYAESYTLGKDLFTESISSPRITVGKFRVCREPDRTLSANLKALGKSSVSRSVSTYVASSNQLVITHMHLQSQNLGCCHRSAMNTHVITCDIEVGANPILPGLLLQESCSNFQWTV